ncbi:PREDICTED: uncharacterized protein LOC109239333 [Nicotiana attenuata]|uniref:uncharacterized protein LOC109239333 n=1 Tax=Nicotiana attenuata TaxID=49451 RepID=UPI000905173D|nr:PREDICTED: uncharacterized protein LOC109239333 [Nicotiana attenuata]
MSNSVNRAEKNNLEDHRENGVDIPGVGVPPRNYGNAPEPIPVDTDSRDAQHVDISSHTNKRVHQRDKKEVQKTPTREERHETMVKYEEEMEENPFADIDEYIEDTNAIVPLVVGAATFKLGDARKWLQNMPQNPIHSWREHLRAFLAKWFPQSKKSELWDNIFFYKKLPGEHLDEACDRFKLYLARSSNHGFPDSILLEKFYMGLDAMNQSIAKNAADGSFMDKTFARITQILDKMAQHNQAWNSEDTTGGIAYGSPSMTNMIKENQERDQVIAGLATNVNVLTKMFIESQTKKVNVVEDMQPIQMKSLRKQTMSKTLKEDIKGNNTKVKDNKINGCLTRKGKMQMRDLSREQNLKQKGRLPSDTIANPKGSGSGPTSHCMEITTRGGKLIQRENEQVVEVEESEQEVEAQVEEPIVVESKRVLEELKVQEVNREEVKEKVKATPKTLPPIPRPPSPLTQRHARKVDDRKLENFYDILKQLSVNIPFVEAFQEMPGFAKNLEDLITKK